MRRVGFAVALFWLACGSEVPDRSPEPFQAALIAKIDPAFSTVLVGSTVLLDGSMSSDPEGRSLELTWTLASRPGSSQAEISATGSALTLVPDQPGDYSVELLVRADTRSARTRALIKANSLPDLAVDLGPDQEVEVGSWVHFIASASGESAASQYSWTIVSKPAASLADLQAAGASAKLFADVEGKISVGLVVRDGIRTAEDTVDVTVKGISPPPINLPPTAVIAGPSMATVGEMISLSATGSSDPEAESLHYLWTLTATPSGSMTRLSASEGNTTILVPDMPGSYEVSLKVTDVHGLTNETTKQLQVVQAPVEWDVFDPGQIYISGTVQEGSCAGALAHVDDPNTAIVGLPCDAEGYSLQIRPADGRIIYLDRTPQLREFRCDDCPFSGPYPPNPAANDPVVPSGCPAGSELFYFHVAPDGTALHNCIGTPYIWRNGAGTAVLQANDNFLMHLGYDGWALLEYSIINIPRRIGADIQGLPFQEPLATRAVPPDSFWQVFPGNGAPELWLIRPGGRVTLVGTYSNQFGIGGEGVLDAEGSLYQIGFDFQSSADVIYRRGLDGFADVVYTEEDDPLVKLHISSLFTGP